MVRVVFVGDAPSRYNINDDLAFVGARCFPRIVEWINYIKPDYYICINSYTKTNLYSIETLHNYGFKVVALGNKAAERLDNFNIRYFKLDHPSGLNRKLNNKQYVDNELKKAYDYVRR